MRVSIAMATYNGEKYLQEQLDSFVCQTRLPDELVVSDDYSSDNTLEILRDFSEKAPFEVRIYQNKENLGYARNFENALSKVTGDLIFLSDQDDVWLPNKIEVVCNIAQNNPDYLLFLNDTEICDGELKSAGLTKFQQITSMGLCLYTDLPIGCCSSFKKALLKIALPIPDYSSHDFWLHQLSNILKVKKVIPVTLQLYRRHNSNASNWIDSRTTKQSRLDLLLYQIQYKSEDYDLEIKQLNSQIKHLSLLLDNNYLDKKYTDKIREAIRELELRKEFR